jgi:hypothetical protein
MTIFSSAKVFSEERVDFPNDTPGLRKDTLADFAHAFTAPDRERGSDQERISNQHLQ